MQYWLELQFRWPFPGQVCKKVSDLADSAKGNTLIKCILPQKPPARSNTKKQTWPKNETSKRAKSKSGTERAESVPKLPTGLILPYKWDDLIFHTHLILLVTIKTSRQNHLFIPYPLGNHRKISNHNDK